MEDVFCQILHTRWIFGMFGFPLCSFDLLHRATADLRVQYSPSEGCQANNRRKTKRKREREREREKVTTEEAEIDASADSFNTNTTKHKRGT